VVDASCRPLIDVAVFAYVVAGIVKKS